MKVMHYILGFPPMRKGGLVQYSLDLINEEAKDNNEISVLFPGNIRLIGSKPKIKKENKYSSNNIEVFSLVNPLPISFFGGLKNPEKFMKPVDKMIFKEFLSTLSPDVIHVHTFLGLYAEFLIVAKELGIKIVYTTHDYSCLAPNPHFFFEGRDFSENNSIEFWLRVSETSISEFKMKIMQSKLYPIARKIGQVFGLRRSISLENNTSKGKTNYSDNEITQMSNLKKYYLSMFDNVDLFHFNSTVSKEVFQKNLGIQIKGTVENITNSKIMDTTRILQKKESSKIRVAYIGPYKEVYKGFFDFVKLAEQLELRKKGVFSFEIWGDTKNIDDLNLINHGRFSSVEEIYENTDLIVVPSKWKETFGLNVSEAMNCGCKVFVSSNVGAKDLLNPNNIFRSIEELVGMVENVNSYDLIDNSVTMSYHEKRIMELYKAVNYR